MYISRWWVNNEWNEITSMSFNHYLKTFSLKWKLCKICMKFGTHVLLSNISMKMKKKIGRSPCYFQKYWPWKIRVFCNFTSFLAILLFSKTLNNFVIIMSFPNFFTCFISIFIGDYTNQNNYCLCTQMLFYLFRKLVKMLENPSKFWLKILLPEIEL